VDFLAARSITAALASCHCCQRNFDYLGPKLILHSDLRRRAASRRALPCPSSYYYYYYYHHHHHHLLLLFTQPPTRRMRICFTDVFFVFFAFSVRHKNTRQPFSGTAERIFVKLLPNDSGENGVCIAVPKWG